MGETEILPKRLTSRKGLLTWSLRTCKATGTQSSLWTWVAAGFSCCGRYRFPLTLWLRTISVCFPPALAIRSLKSRCQRSTRCSFQTFCRSHFIASSQWLEIAGCLCFWLRRPRSASGITAPSLTLPLVPLRRTLVLHWSWDNLPTSRSWTSHQPTSFYHVR